MRKRLLLAALVALTGCSSPKKESPIDPACLESLRPLEHYMEARTTPLDDKARDEIRILLEEPYDVCSRRDFAVYRDAVITPWASNLMPD